MNFLISAKTDVGTVKDINQDSVSVKVINTAHGRIVLAVLCDGMGGYSNGEAASASVIHAFDQWARNDLPQICKGGFSDLTIRKQWENLIKEQNSHIISYGIKHDCMLGTTVVALLITQTRYYILNVGDSRAYVINDKLHQITKDHSLVAMKIGAGLLTPEQAERDMGRSQLLRCVGISEDMYPDLFFGDVKKGEVFMLCSDGFRHEVSESEIYEMLNPRVLTDEKKMSERAESMIELNKQRQEKDNITVALIKTV